MMNSSDVKGCCTHHYKCISWSAILVGALVGVGLSFLLNLFSIAIGLSVVSTTKEGLATLAVGGLIGVAIGTIAAMWTAGFTAGFLGYKPLHNHNLGVIYGFTAWCVALILTVLLAGQIGQYVSAYTTFIGKPAAVVSVEPTTTTVASTTSKEAVTVNTEKGINAIGVGGLSVFVLFFLGALSSALGGYSGTDCRRRCCEKDIKDV